MLKQVEIGQWFFPVKEFPYDENYIKKYEGYAQTKMGKEITKLRIELIKSYNDNPETNLDVGVGSGDIVNAIKCFGYDVNPHMIYKLSKQGQFKNLYTDDLTEINTISFFDSFEHIEDIDKVLEVCKGKIIIISLPIFKGKTIKELKEWKHYREDEHYHYFTPRGFVNYIERKGFILLEISEDEEELGREDIRTFVIQRGN